VITYSEDAMVRKMPQGNKPVEEWDLHHDPADMNQGSRMSDAP